MRNDKQMLEALRLKIATLREELATCTTKAMAASVQGSLDAAEWELEKELDR